MLEQIFTKEFLKKARKNTVIALSLLKYIFVIVGIPGALLFACGLDAPDPYGTNAIIGCFVCVGMLLVGMLIEMFVVRFLVKENEHIHCIFDFNWYGLKNAENYAEYKRYIKLKQAEQRRRDNKFKQIISVANAVNTNDNIDRSNVIQMSKYMNTNNRASISDNIYKTN